MQKAFTGIGCIIITMGKIDNFSRRGIIQLSGLSVTFILSGCSSVYDNTSTNDCSAIKKPMPESPPEGLETKTYPNMPERLNIDSVTKFAVDHEEAYRFNRYIKSEIRTGIDNVFVNSYVESAQKDNGKYYIHTDGEIKASDTRQADDSAGTRKAPSTVEFNTWYLISEDRALRKEVNSSTESRPSFKNASVVWCRSKN